MKSDLIYELKDVHHAYLKKYPALCGIDMKIAAGEKIAIIGANGTGKSTLLQVLDGLIFPERGEIRAFGKDLNEKAFLDESFSRIFRRRVGFVFQNPDIQLFCPTVKEDIVFGPLQLGMSMDETRRKCDEIADLLNIQALMNRTPHQLSVGEKRKVAIATTLMSDPDVLILDEPTAGLDPQTSRHIIDIIHRANEQGKTVISSTHDLHMVAELADVVYVFGREKKIISFGPTEKVLADTGLLEANNLVHIHRHRHGLIWHEHPHQHNL